MDKPCPLSKYHKLRVDPHSRKMLTRFLGVFVFLIVGLFAFSLCEANDFELAMKDLGNKSRSKIKMAVKRLGNMGNPKALPALEALKNKRLKIDEDGVLIILNEAGDQGRDALNGNPVDLSSLTLRKPRINNSVRRVLSMAIGKLKLTSDSSEVRLEAARDLLKRPSSDLVELIEKALNKENDNEVREIFMLVLAKEGLNSDDKNKRLQSLNTINKFGNNDFKTDLETLLEKNDAGEFLESDPDIRDRAAKAISKIENRQFFINQAANLFYGLSLGSILLLASLGLAITFGLMGVINMAHGEMIAIGGYSAYVMQKWMTGLYGDEALQWYFLLAIPFAFLTAATAGLLMERSVIRFLYRRPLESLLATWAVSMILQQCFRLYFGAANVQVNSPDWLIGSVSLGDMSFNYNRLFVIVFAAIIVLGTWFLMSKTPLGLSIRAVMQNRDMAASIGIRASRVRMVTFAFGSGLAGLAALLSCQAVICRTVPTGSTGAESSV